MRAAIEVLAFLLPVLAQAGCTWQEMAYEGTRDLRAEQCYAMTEPERTECLSEAYEPYDAYERRRTNPGRPE